LDQLSLQGERRRGAPAPDARLSILTVRVCFTLLGTGKEIVRIKSDDTILRSRTLERRIHDAIAIRIHPERVVLGIRQRSLGCNEARRDETGTRRLLRTRLETQQINILLRLYNCLGTGEGLLGDGEFHSRPSLDDLCREVLRQARKHEEHSNNAQQ